MQCTRCQSNNTQHLQVIYEAGTQVINTTSRTTEGLGGTSAHGISRSIAAKKAAPPPKNRLYKAGIVLLIIALIAFYFQFALFFTILLLAIGTTLCVFSYKYNTEKWPPIYKVWEGSWMCGKCGNIYQHYLD